MHTNTYPLDYCRRPTDPTPRIPGPIVVSGLLIALMAVPLFGEFIALLSNVF